MSINKKWNPCEIDRFNSVSKIQAHLKSANTEYLIRHPEVYAIIRTLLHEAINRDEMSPAQLAPSVFDCNVNVLLKSKIQKEVEVVLKEREKSNWDKFNSEALLSKTSSAESLLSNSSLVDNMNSILRFCLILPNGN